MKRLSSVDADPLYKFSLVVVGLKAKNPAERRDYFFNLMIREPGGNCFTQNSETNPHHLPGARALLSPADTMYTFSG
jgi:hypothetical protein